MIIKYNHFLLSTSEKLSTDYHYIGLRNETTVFESLNLLSDLVILISGVVLYIRGLERFNFSIFKRDTTPSTASIYTANSLTTRS
jgi:hypothetical protein